MGGLAAAHSGETITLPNPIPIEPRETRQGCSSHNVPVSQHLTLGKIDLLFDAHRD
jgi:hypothetical protein